MNEQNLQRVVSVSLGSSARDHTAVLEISGQKLLVSREGYDGDVKAVEQRVKELDGQIEVIGMGGQDLYLFAGNKRYELRCARKLVKLLKRSQIVDGSGLKNTLERQAIRYLRDNSEVPITGKSVLMVSGLDRFGMAESLVEAGCKMVYGDLIFALDIPIPIYSLKKLALWAKLLMPIVSQFPIAWIYPTGDKQLEKSNKDYSKYYEANVIAGDFHFIRRTAPKVLLGKTIITNTVTLDDVKMLRERGVRWLVTTTPNLDGRSFGTNVIEAAFLTILKKKWEDVLENEYLQLIKENNFQPRVERLN